MFKLPLGCGLALLLAAFAYAPQALAQKVTRDPTVSTRAAPPPRKPPPVAAEPAPNLPKLTAAQIVEKNEAARGGAGAWRAVQTITANGKLDAGGKQDTLLPVKMQIKRPNKQRVSIDFAGHTAVQVFDGEHGWKLRPFMNRRDPEPYSPEELKKALAQPPFEGLLIDSAAKGVKDELEGTEMVDKTPTYRLKVTTKEGNARHIWIDGKTFLEAKIEDEPHHFNGKMHKTETYYRDYHRVGGIEVPYVMETRVDTDPQSHALTFEKLVLNEKMDDSLFAKPASLTDAELPSPPKFVKEIRPRPPAPSQADPNAASH
jgi:outer membrane lipoprotein-sorting protein